MMRNDWMSRVVITASNTNMKRNIEQLIHFPVSGDEMLMVLNNGTEEVQIIYYFKICIRQIIE